MKQKAKNTLKDILETFGVGITRHSKLKQLYADERKLRKVLLNLEFFKALPEHSVLDAIHAIADSRAQLHQDIFVLSELSFKERGFFVEIGASNGMDLSNTYLLEKKFNWNGILCEPAKVWHLELDRNRDCMIEHKCVWRSSGEKLEFFETKTKELSTINEFVKNDFHKDRRTNGITYKIDSISLEDLLDKYNAPKEIDYLSVDTEGSEWEILKEFDFNKYCFSVITCEHNFTDNRERIYELLSSKGYKRKFETFSKFDDWYVGRTSEK